MGFNELLAKYGFSDTEKLLNEFNYITTFLGEDWKYSIRVEKGLKGASYALSVMCVAQKEDVDMLMYYDARPCIMNGMFNTDTLEPLKTYYVYRAFRDIRELGECAFSESTDKAIYEVASTDGKDGALLFTLHTGADEPTKKDISIEVSGAKHGECVRAEIYLLDDNNDLTLMREEFFTSDRFNLRMRIENYASYLVKFINE